VLPREAPEEGPPRSSGGRTSGEARSLAVLPREAPEEKLRRKSSGEKLRRKDLRRSGPPEKHVVLKTSQVLSFRSTIKRRRRGSCAI